MGSIAKAKSMSEMGQRLDDLQEGCVGGWVVAWRLGDLGGWGAGGLGGWVAR